MIFHRFDCPLRLCSIQANDLGIPSYCVELITIHASNQVRPQSADAIFKKVLELLRGCSNLRIAFDDNYVSANYTRYVLCDSQTEFS